jgi:hypothetical protein
MMIAMGCRLPVVWAYIYALPAAAAAAVRGASHMMR